MKIAPFVTNRIETAHKLQIQGYKLGIEAPGRLVSPSFEAHYFWATFETLGVPVQKYPKYTPECNLCTHARCELVFNVFKLIKFIYHGD